MGKNRKRCTTITVHVDPDGRGGWATYKKLPKGCRAVSVLFDKEFKGIRDFRVPRRQRKYIYIVVGPKGLIYKLPKGCCAKILWNCGGAGVP